MTHNIVGGRNKVLVLVFSVRFFFFLIVSIVFSNLSFAQFTVSGNNIYYNTGLVGIGTPTPWARLDVRTAGTSAGDQQGLNVQNPSTAAYGAVQISLGSGDLGSGNGSASLIYAQRNNLGLGSSLFFWNSDASGIQQPRMTITDGGNVGIGTTTPQSRMHLVQNDNLAALVLESSSLGWGSGMYFKNTTPTTGRLYGIYSSSFGSLNIADATAGVDRIFIAANGNVGINTNKVSDVNYRFYVEGAIRTRRIVVDQATWSDYVFDSAYRRMPLEQLASYVQEKRHLPEVPSADSVAKNGLDLGGSQAVLLKKIEELTLYIIEQNRKIEALNERMKAMETRR